MGALFGKSDDERIAEYFKGKVVWITGASGGLGRELCLCLCKASAPAGLILSARNEKDLQEVRDQCLELRPALRAEVLTLDLNEIDTLQSKVDQALKAFTCVDVLINNGGRGYRDLAQDTGIEVDRDMMNVNFFSGVALTKGLLGKWLERRYGHVVQISSVQSFFGLPGRTAYSATKHAVVGFYDSLRAEVEDQGVTVTLVAPGYIATNHSQNAASGTPGKRSYPEGHTSKAVPADVMAVHVLAAAARRKQEVVPAANDALAARVLRSCCPRLLFWVMRKRAKKEASLLSKL